MHAVSPAVQLLLAARVANCALSFCAAWPLERANEEVEVEEAAAVLPAAVEEATAVEELPPSTVTVTVVGTQDSEESDEESDPSVDEEEAAVAVDEATLDVAESEPEAELLLLEEPPEPLLVPTELMLLKKGACQFQTKEMELCIYALQSWVLSDSNELRAIRNTTRGVRGAAARGLKSGEAEGDRTRGTSCEVSCECILGTVKLALEETRELAVLGCLLAVRNLEGVGRVARLLDEDLGELDHIRVVVERVR